MAAATGKKRSVMSTGVIIIVITVLMVLSLVVRWLGIGGRIASDNAPFQVEVLNGTGEAGLAMKTAKALRLMGVDVLLVGNAESFDFEQSLIIDRKGNPKLMKELSRLTGCCRVILQFQSDPLVDATLVIGSDIGSLKIGNGCYGKRRTLRGGYIGEGRS